MGLEHALIIDNDAESTQSLGALLKRESCRVRHAGDAEAAWEAVSDDIPDIVFMDAAFQDPTGLDLIAHIREYAPRAPIVMISAPTDASAPAKAHDAQVHQTIPFFRNFRDGAPKVGQIPVAKYILPSSNTGPPRIGQNDMRRLLPRCLRSGLSFGVPRNFHRSVPSAAFKQ